jgi:hypothetical protein
VLTYTFGYAYDAVGNRTVQTRTITSTQVMNYVYDAANRLTSVNGLAYTWDDKVTWSTTVRRPTLTIRRIV